MAESTKLMLDDGTQLRFTKTGSGPPLILLHTIRTQLEYFRDVVPRLENHFTVYALDLPGHGGSSIDKRAPYDEPYLRRGVTSFIEKLDISDVVLVGESIGGVLAITAASELPDRVRAVISINPYDYDTRYADGVRRGNVFANVVLGTYAIPVIGAINAALENSLFLGWVMAGGFQNARNMPRDLIRLFDRTGRRAGFRYVERAVFAKWRSWAQARHLYDRVNVPVTFLYSSSDWSSPGDVDKNKRAFPSANFITLEQTGHFASLENPQAVAKEILDAVGA